MTHPGPSHPGPSGPAQPSPPSRGVSPLLDEHIARGMPAPTYGHLPIAAHESATYRHGSLDLAAGHLDAGAGGLPRIGTLISNAENTLAQADHILTRPYDPASAGDAMDQVDDALGYAVQCVRWALARLAHAAALDLPPAGSAVMFDAAAGREYGGHHTEAPARRDPVDHWDPTAIATTGGPVDHPMDAGEGRTPGLQVGATPMAAAWLSPGRPTTPGAGAKPYAACCVGKSLNDGVPALCGSPHQHMPHRLDAGAVAAR